MHQFYKLRIFLAAILRLESKVHEWVYHVHRTRMPFTRAWHVAGAIMSLSYGWCTYASPHCDQLHMQTHGTFPTLCAKQEVQRQLYNRQVHGDMHQVGDYVWLHTTVLSGGTTKKLHHPWTGPYRIIRRLSDSTYWIQLLWAPHKRLVVHFNWLKPYGDAIEGSLPEEDTSVSGEPVPEPPVTGTRLDVVEPEDIPAQSEPYQPLPPVIPTIATCSPSSPKPTSASSTIPWP